MKKALLMLAAILMVVSGVAAVSAYESHVINVTAHVENALYVDTDNVSFGVMFPQEWNKIKREIRLSDSAIDELPESKDGKVGDLGAVEFTVYAEWKLDPYDGTDFDLKPDVEIGGKDYVAWIGEWLWVAYPAADQGDDNPMLFPKQWSNVGVAPDYKKGEMAKVITGAPTYTLSTKDTDYIDILFLAPCFEGYYNSYTDVKPKWWPTNWDTPGPWPLIMKDDYRYFPAGVDLGCDLKIQITNIHRYD